MYRNLEAEIKKSGISFADMARKLGLSDLDLQKKINGQSEIGFGEAMIIRNLYFKEMTLEYLFERKD